MANENVDVLKVVGIKKVAGKDERIYVTFFCVRPFTEYDVENSLSTVGNAVETVSANEDFGVQIGDAIEFKYGKAIPTKTGGVYQPVKGVIFVSRANGK